MDEIFDGDHVVGLGFVTPARGVVILPVTNFGLRDRALGTIALNSSVGVPRKLERMRRNPRVALAFHTRRHSLAAGQQYVLVQGRARLTDPVPDYPGTALERWERFESWADLSPLWKRWQRVYALRVEIVIAVERITTWPDLRCLGRPIVHGAPAPEGPVPSQSPPAKGTGPRVGIRVARRLPDVLLGWADAGGFPAITPVELGPSSARGIEVRSAAGLLPLGRRRAGLTAHSFARQVVGQHQHKFTGWLEAESPERGHWAPHTRSSYWLPPSRLLYRTATGLFTRRGLGAARAAGLLERDA